VDVREPSPSAPGRPCKRPGMRPMPLRAFPLALLCHSRGLAGCRRFAMFATVARLWNVAEGEVATAERMDRPSKFGHTIAHSGSRLRSDRSANRRLRFAGAAPLGVCLAWRRCRLHPPLTRPAHGHTSPHVLSGSVRRAQRRHLLQAWRRGCVWRLTQHSTAPLPRRRILGTPISALFPHQFAPSLR
jgi:hypothetical protein